MDDVLCAGVFEWEIVKDQVGRIFSQGYWFRNYLMTFFVGKENGGSVWTKKSA